jgi:acyl-CoA thioesterase-1
LLRLQDCGIPVLLTTVAPPAILRDRAAAYLGIHADLAADYGATVRPFFPPGVLGHPDMVLADKVHPNAKAIAAVVAALRDAVEAML